MDKLREMIESFHSSITLLSKSGYDKQSLYLFFTYLDQLGWLISPNKFSNGSDFRNWIDTYCDLAELRCTSTDLWNTRCSLLHMGTAEHKHFDSEKHFRLSFYKNVKYSDQELVFEERNYPKPTKLVDIFVLYDCVNDGINNFLQALVLDATIKSSVLDKCEEMNNLYVLNK